jgi:hypothetical protein
MLTPLEYQSIRIRQMSADQKIRVAHLLWVGARNSIQAGVRAEHPDWIEKQVAQRVRELMRDAGP